MRNNTKIAVIVIATAFCTAVLFVGLAVVTLVGASANQQRQQDNARERLACVQDNIRSSTTRQCTQH